MALKKGLNITKYHFQSTKLFCLLHRLMPCALASTLSFLEARTFPAGSRIRVCHRWELRAHNVLTWFRGKRRLGKDNFVNCSPGPAGE